MNDELLEKFGTGALDDTRSFEAKSKDWRFEELAGAPPVVNWREKPQSEWRKFPIFNQTQSSSCVAQSWTKILGVENYLEEGRFIQLSAQDFYNRRANKPSPGMNFDDAGKIASTYGATLNEFINGQELSEEQMNQPVVRKSSDLVIAQLFKGGPYIWIPFDIDAIASIIQRGKAVSLSFRWAYAEWDQPVPTILGTDIPYHHNIAGVDFTLYQGKKAIIIDDSWGKNRGLDGQRIVTEDWIKSRMTSAIYAEDRSNLKLIEQSVPKPKFNFQKDLSIGMIDGDVKLLQDCLKYEGLFPSTQNSTTYFGGITLKAVKDFQTKNGLPNTGLVGPQTRSILNQKYE